MMWDFSVVLILAVIAVTLYAALAVYAIEELLKAHDNVNEAHNEGYDVGYWAGRRDYEPKWIPVEERLPDFEGAVLCLRKSYTHPGMRYQEIMYVDENGFSNVDNIYAEPGNVTHWMPLPEPPKEET